MLDKMQQNTVWTTSTLAVNYSQTKCVIYSKTFSHFFRNPGVSSYANTVHRYC